MAVDIVHHVSSERKAMICIWSTRRLISNRMRFVGCEDKDIPADKKAKGCVK